MSPRPQNAGPLLRALLLLLLATFTVGPAAPSEDVVWMRVLHRQFPIAFDVPEETSVQRVGVFGLGRPRTDERELIEVDIFGLRDLPLNLAAVQFGFFWITEEYAGADASSLPRLRAEIEQGSTSVEFLRDVFYRNMDVRMRDAGRHYVDGKAGRRIEVERLIARGTRDERSVRGQVVLVPLSESTALAVIARFDETATSEEVSGLFPRVLDSVRIGSSDRPGSLQTRIDGLRSRSPGRG
jgi:hypothetical protein